MLLLLTQDFVLLLPNKTVTYQSGHDVVEGTPSANTLSNSNLEDLLGSSSMNQGAACAHARAGHSLCECDVA
jgi:hypothetical protein